MKPINYLDIAEAVLKTARRPLSSRAIMQAAHRGGIVPAHLYGKTQHKTLHARLSEDILQHKLESRFFRTEPGLFFLSEMRSDPTIPESYKDPFHARRRTRDLFKPAALAFDRDFLDSRSIETLGWQELVKSADRVGALKHVDPRIESDRIVLVWAFSVVRRRDKILSYRIGRYRDQRDAFANRKSIGFAEMVGFQDATLFSEDMGVQEAGLNAILSDLDLSRSAFAGEIVKPSVSFAVIAIRTAREPVALCVLEWTCPDWFEPTARRLSLNDLRWIDATHKPNDIAEFEPWSALALEALVEQRAQKALNGEKINCATSRLFTL
jgi:HB1, ASXL, restriction endonuclease HTH domain